MLVELKVTSWYDAFVAMIPNLLVALIIGVVGFYATRFMVRALDKGMLSRIKHPSIKSLALQAVRFVALAVVIFLMLVVLDLDQMVTSVLAGAGILGLAAGLALQGAMSNSYSGIMMALKDSIKVGDFIVTNGHRGTVKEIGLRSTTLIEPDNNLVIIPNNKIFEDIYKNYSLTHRSKVILECGVGYESDLQHVKNVVIRTILNRDTNLEKDDIDFYYTSFGDSSINFVVRYWMDASDSIAVLYAKSDIIMAIKKAFDRENINIPFPIRTLQIDQPAEIKSSHFNIKSKKNNYEFAQ